jgi:hypothetical protein
VNSRERAIAAQRRITSPIAIGQMQRGEEDLREGTNREREKR